MERPPEPYCWRDGPGMGGLHVIADDLTGACDVAASLLPWGDGVAVHPDGRPAGPGDCLVVRNTQSRTLPPARAAERVRQVLANHAGPKPSVLLKKIDTGLRGPLGAEIDAAMDALGAPRAFVLPAIPEVGRTTVGGEQRIGGVPVHRTPFADDPRNPVRDARVAAAIAATGSRAAAALLLQHVRRPGGLAAALAGCQEPIVVIDAETDADLAASVRVVLGQPGPLLIVGSTGVARALRDALAPPDAAVAPLPDTAEAGGVLVVSGSAHPAARAQCERAERDGAIDHVVMVSPDDAAPAGLLAARRIGAGRSVALCAPHAVARGLETTVGAALRTAAVAALAQARPRGLLLVGGETAYEVLAGLGHPRLVVEGRCAPLAVRARIASGPHAGLVVVTKGGSSGEAGLLAALVGELRGGGGDGGR